MNLSPPLTVAERIVVILDGLHRAVAARSRLSVLVGRGTEVLAIWLINLVCLRVRRTQGRLLRMLARFQAGKLLVRPPGVRVGVARRTQTTRRRLAAEEKLPRKLSWLLPLVPCEAANFASQLRLTLAEPEMVALLAASAQARRLLAPLCRMLGIEASVLLPKVPAAEADEIPPVATAAWPPDWTADDGPAPPRWAGRGLGARGTVPDD